MTHLLDTHAWIQRALGEELPSIADEIFLKRAGALAISNISLWEAAKWVELGRLELSVSLEDFFRLAVTPELTVLPVSTGIAEKVTRLEGTGFHKDPADQLIVATAVVHGLILITDDGRIRKWGGVRTVWRNERSGRDL
jgi:PIN domain nuclease of toxin-antitoxin system